MTLTQTWLNSWTYPHLQAGALIGLNVLIALILGLILGYERTYHGRAAGMRTYGLVCMVSAAVLSISGFPGLWFGTHVLDTNFYSDPTRTIQGILTGIGFLCAGVIMKEGFSISGLTTAASIWAVSAVGILVGVGFYASAIFLVLGAVVCMTLVSNLEAYLPSRTAIAVKIKFKVNFIPDMQIIKDSVTELGFKLTQGSISISYQQGAAEWNFIALTLESELAGTLHSLSLGLKKLDGVDDIYLTHARN